MSATATFRDNEGISAPSQSLAIFLRTYAQSKNVPIWENSSILGECQALRSIKWNDSMLQTGYVATEITVQEFLAKCDAYAAAEAAKNAPLETRRVIELGDYSNVVVDAETSIMSMNGQDIAFADIRKVMGLIKNVPSKTSTFSSSEGLDGPAELIVFLGNYAKEKGVPFGNSRGYNLLDENGEVLKNLTRIRYNVDESDSSLNGMIDYGFNDAITPQQFIEKCDGYEALAPYTWQLTETYKVRVNHEINRVQVGCQNIHFNRVEQLVGILDELEANVATNAKQGR